MKENEVFLEESIEREIISYANEKKVLIERNAVELIKKKTNWKELIEELVREKQDKGKFAISAKDVEEKLINARIETTTQTEIMQTIMRNEIQETQEEETKGMETRAIETQKKERVKEKEIEINEKVFRAKAAGIKADYRILDEFNITDKSSSEGKVEDFLHYFQDKFNSLEKMINSHPHFSPKPIKRLKTVMNKTEVDVIGMVSKKWVTKNSHTAFELEDLEKKCIMLILKDERELEKEKELIQLDNVIGVRGVKVSDEMIIAKQIIWPDLPIRKETEGRRELLLVGVSDLHIGSKLFLGEAFEKFLQWINGNVEDEKERELVGKIKYIVVSGDNVDGIGIYPSQYDELAIKDIFKQYEAFSELMLRIPEHIEIFIIPGQHDAVRWADPQPAIGKEYVPELYNAKNIHLLSSPGWIEIEGLKILLYHGASLHDFFSQVSFLNALHPEKGILELVKKRDLMCTYGMGRPYVPEKKDYMVIRQEPDFVFIGDHHKIGYANYHGTTIINNSTFQAETAYQIEQGHIATPGIIPLINLKTRAITEKHFIEGKTSDRENRTEKVILLE